MKEDHKEQERQTVQSLREAAGLTQEELARKLNRSTRIVSDWDHSRRLPRIDNAAELAKELGVSLKVLFQAFGLEVKDIPDDSPKE
jgi:ribosome-binding protein aMBF1 (putative translation factor)